MLVVSYLSWHCPSLTLPIKILPSYHLDIEIDDKHSDEVAAEVAVGLVLKMFYGASKNTTPTSEGLLSILCCPCWHQKTWGCVGRVFRSTNSG